MGGGKWRGKMEGGNGGGKWRGRKGGGEREGEKGRGRKGGREVYKHTYLGVSFNSMMCSRQQ